MFRAVPLGRALGKSFSFPVDTSSRAFRRARSETLPFEQLDLSSVQLKHAPIALRWRSAEEPLSRGQAPRAEAVETGVSLPIDPHRLGFGSQAVSLRRRPPPPCPLWDGILGVNPRLGTRGEIGVGGDSTSCGDGIHPARVALADSTTIGDGNHPDLGLPLPLPSEAPSHFAAIDDFVSFFLPSQPKTFAQVVRASPSPLMDRGGGSCGRTT